MQINSSERYLHILQNTLNTVILPELSTGAAKAAVGMMTAVLTELLKREGEGLTILQQNIEAGRVLARTVAQRLAHFEPQVPNEALCSDTSGLLEQHRQITEVLAALCEKLRGSELADNDKVPLLRQVAEWELAYYAKKTDLAVPAPALIKPAGSPLTREALEAFLNSDSAEPITLRRFEPLTGGFGKQTYLCDYLDQRGELQEIVVRKTDPTPIMTHGACDLENEYTLLRTLAPLNYPAPKPERFAARWQDVDGSFYTMPRIAGATPGSFLGGLHGEVDESIMLDLAELLGRLHRVPFETFGDYIQKFDDPRILGGTIEDCYRYNLEGWQRYMQSENHLPSPYLSWLLDWLFRNIPRDTRRPILIHGDFNIHNVLVHEGHITGVLDWECAGFGSPEQDLAYIQPHISRYIDWNRFVAHYQAHGGYDINPDAMAFGMVYSALRTNLAGNRGTQNLQTGANVDIRYAMVELGFTQSFMGLALSSATTP